jgi:OOP family OmpA-OmpF porin
MNKSRQAAIQVLVGGFIVFGSGALVAAPGDQPVPPLPAGKPSNDKDRVRSTSMPARGLFVGDQLSDTAKAKLSELVIEALGMRIEVALVVPEGPWKIDGSGAHERDLTPARLAAVRRFLTERGVDPGRIFVESRIDARVKEPRLEVQMVGQPAQD